MSDFSTAHTDQGRLTINIMTGMERGQADFGRRWLAKGKDALERGQISEAIETLRQAIETDSRSVEAHLYLGLALVKDAQVYEAVDIFEAGLAQSPKDFMLNLKLGELYLGLCVPDKGRTHLLTAMEASSTPQERELVRTLMSRETERDNRRIYRPTFEKP